MTSDHSADDPVDSVENYRARSGNDEVTRFARDVVQRAVPKSDTRAKAFLFGAMKLGSFGASVGLELVPEVLLHEAVIERCVLLSTSTLSPATRRTLRTNLRALARDVLEPSGPRALLLARERAKVPYSPAQLDAYFALARHQPTEARRRQGEGLLTLGAGAGLTGALRMTCGRYMPLDLPPPRRAALASRLDSSRPAPRARAARRAKAGPRRRVREAPASASRA